MPAPDPKLLEAVAKMPARDAEASKQVCRQLVAGGAAWIEQLIAIVGEPGAEAGIKPRYAFHALAVYTARSKAEDERKLFAHTVAGQLDAKHSPEVKAFLIEQLQLAATPAEVPALAKRVADKRLGQPAISALVAIGGDEAAAALRDALPSARGRLRVAIIQGLGRLRDKPSVAALTKAAGAKDRDVRLAAFFALGNIGEPAAAAVLQAAPAVETPYERSQRVDACLLLAQRLAEQGKDEDAKAIYEHLLKTHTGPDDKHVRHAATQGLGQGKK